MRSPPRGAEDAMVVLMEKFRGVLLDLEVLILKMEQLVDETTKGRRGSHNF
jgi:hypothetical protein